MYSQKPVRNMPLHIDSSVVIVIRKKSDIPCISPPASVGVLPGRKGKYMTEPSSALLTFMVQCSNWPRVNIPARHWQ